MLATDFAPEMIRALETRLAETGVENVETAVMDGQALDLPDGGFDRVASAFGLMLFPDRAAGFAELRRCLARGGRAAVCTWAGPQRMEAFAAFGAAMGRAFPDMPPPRPPVIFSLADPGQLAREMRKAGFADVEVTEMTTVADFGTADRAWALSTSGAPPAMAMRRAIGDAGMGKFCETYLADLADRFGEGPVKFSNTALVATGIRPN